MDQKCPVCDRDAEVKITNESNADIFRVDCTNCSIYYITGKVRKFLPFNQDIQFKKRLERYLWETKGEEDRLITSGKLPPDQWQGRSIDLESAAKLYEDDGSPLRKYENTVRNIATRTEVFGHEFHFRTDRWLVPTLDDNEAMDILNALMYDGIISLDKTHDQKIDFALTTTGLKYAAELSKQSAGTGNIVFVAARFSTEMKSAIDTIEGVLRELKYEPRIVDRIAHNELIDLQIYQGIRESRFMVADLTWNRQSVYYEIGFAHGLGLDVVLTCRKDCFEHGTDDEICKTASFKGKPCAYKRVHFDLEHRNILQWEDEDELRNELREHIYQSPGPYRA